MKLSHFLVCIAVATSASLAYVWQQTEIFRIAYANQKSFARFNELLDENSILRYNLKSGTSLVRIAGKLSAAGDFAMPENYCLVKVPAEQVRIANSSAKSSFASRIMGIGRQAEAKTISSSTGFGAR